METGWKFQKEKYNLVWKKLRQPSALQDMLPFARKVELLRKLRERSGRLMVWFQWSERLKVWFQRSGRLIVWFHMKHTPAAILSAPKGKLKVKIAPICGDCGGAYLRMRWTESFLIIFLEFEMSTFKDWDICLTSNWEIHREGQYLAHIWECVGPDHLQSVSEMVSQMNCIRRGFIDLPNPTDEVGCFAHDVFFSQILVVALTEPTFLEFEIKRQTLPEAQRTQKLTPWLGLNLETTWHH